MYKATRLLNSIYIPSVSITLDCPILIQFFVPFSLSEMIHFSLQVSIRFNFGNTWKFSLNYKPKSYPILTYPTSKCTTTYWEYFTLLKIKVIEIFKIFNKGIHHFLRSLFIKLHQSKTKFTVEFWHFRNRRRIRTSGKHLMVSRACHIGVNAFILYS